MESKNKTQVLLDSTKGQDGRATVVGKQKVQTSEMLVSDIDPNDLNCIADLKSVIEELRREILSLMEEQQKELRVQLDIQKGDMLKREASLHNQISALKSDLGNLTEKLRTLLKVEKEREKELEKLSTERQQLADLLYEIQKEQEQREKCVHCSENKGKVTNV